MARSQVHEQAVGSPVLRRQSLEAVVTRACVSCQAPGVYSSAESVRAGWPACWVPPGDPRVGQPLSGDRCPQCGDRKPRPEQHGEIWTREWRVVTTLGRLARRFRRLKP